MTLLVGWDVGGWNCGHGPSQDALCVLDGTAFADLRVLGAWRGNLRRFLVEGTCPDALLTPMRLEHHANSEVVVAIDAPLGWPDALHALLERDPKPLPKVPETVIENPYIFRRTEQSLVSRGLFPEGRTPLSAVRDMIGSQSSKAIYFLRKSGMEQSHAATWRTGSWTALETYPTPVRTSAMLQTSFEDLRGDAAFVKRAKLGKNAAADLDDALWCALVAATYRFAPASLAWPPDADDVVTREGWIFVPSDCSAPDDVTTDEASPATD